MPVQTVGNIIFQEQAKAMSCVLNGKIQRRCAIINKKTQVRFEDGTIENRVAYEVSVGSLEVVEENEEVENKETNTQEAV